MFAFFSLSIAIFYWEEEEGFSLLGFFFDLDLLANFSGVFSRSRAARTDVMFRNLLPKEVFTRLFSLYMTRNVYLGSIYSFLLQ